MANLQKVALGTPPDGKDGDAVRTANVKANGNVDILNAQAALTTYPNQITSNQDLPADCVGKRVNIYNSNNVGLPPASAAGVDGYIVLRNVGTVSTGISPGAGNPTAPQAAFMSLHPGESVAFDTDGVNPWRVLFRGRGSANETIDGTLTLGAGIAGNLSATGKLNGANSPNLLLNGSGELGNTGWQTSNFAALVGGSGEGTLFSNANPVSVTTVDSATPFAITAGAPLALSAKVYTGGMTAGAAEVDVQFFNSAMAPIGFSDSRLTFPFGQGFTTLNTTFTTPSGTAYACVRKYADAASGNPAAGAFGIRFGSIKLESGNNSSLYSQEASVAYLSGTATDTTAGLTRTATQAEVNAGVVDYPAVVTPKKLRLGFAALFGTTGFIAFPTWLGGLIFNWGQASTNSGGDATVAFTKPFTTAQFVCIPVIVSNYTNCLLTMTGFTLTNANFHVNDYTGSGGVRPLQYLAVGI